MAMDKVLCDGFSRSIASRESNLEGSLLRMAIIRLGWLHVTLLSPCKTSFLTIVLSFPGLDGDKSSSRRPTDSSIIELPIYLVLKSPSAEITCW